MTKPTEEILRLSLQERIDLAMKATFRRVVEEHRRAGIPLTILRDGKVVEVPADEFLNGDVKLNGGDGKEP